MPTRHRGRPAGLSGQAPVLSQEQVKRVLRLIRGQERDGSRAEAAFCLSLYLGLRAKEIAALKWGDVYDDNNGLRDVLQLKAAYTKGAKTRTSYIVAPKLRQVLTEYNKLHRDCRNPNGPLLRSQRGGNMTASSMVRLLKQLYMSAGIPEASSHTGRRTFITNLAERGVDLKAIATLAGHSDIKTTALYVDASPQKLSRILAEISFTDGK